MFCLFLDDFLAIVDIDAFRCGSALQQAALQVVPATVGRFAVGVYGVNGRRSRVEVERNAAVKYFFR